MRKFSEDFANHIRKQATTLCWCWQVVRHDGLVLGFTDHDNDLEIDGIIYQAKSGFDASHLHEKLGFDVDLSAAQGLLMSEQISAADIKAGLYDNARVKLLRVNWQNAEQNAVIWSGSFGQINIKGDAFEVELLGQSAELENVSGRVFARGCDASFGDTRCGLNKADFPDGTECARTINACRNFNNVINFRGFPYLIGEDAVYAGPEKHRLKDGSSRY